MPSVELVVGVLILVITLSDAFETIVLPRNVQRRVRLTRLIVRASWTPWALLTRLPMVRSRREPLLAIFGPMLLILLVISWAVGMVIGYGLFYYGLAQGPFGLTAHSIDLGNAIYLSGSTLFTLGLGDFTPWSPLTRALTVLEAGMGFGFLAMVIAYLPIFYQAFSRREVSISLLDAHAGSPPTAVELIRRNHEQVADVVLREWEAWAAELLESHLSYPILAFFRSQHERQSWLGALIVILDASALLIAGVEGLSDRQARFTFAIARHALVDLAQIFYANPLEPAVSRLDSEGFAELRSRLDSFGFALKNGSEAESTLAELRGFYEGIGNGLAQRLLLDMPPWIPVAGAVDDWQTSPWDSLPPI